MITVKKYKCEFCEKIYTKKQNRFNHIKLDHPEQNMSRKRTIESVLSDQDQPMEPIIRGIISTSRDLGVSEADIITNLMSRAWIG